MKKSKETFEELTRQQAVLHAKITTIVRNRRKAEYRKLLGKCYKVENKYDNLGQIWWRYIMYVRMTGDALTVFMFEDDGNGKLEVVTDGYGHPPGEHYLPISLDEFMSAWKRQIVKLNETFPCGMLNIQATYI